MHDLKKSLGTPLLLFAMASLMMGLYTGFYDPSFNNYLYQTQNVSPLARGALEFPRELPGFLIVFLVSALIFMADTRLVTLAALFVGIGLWGQGFLSPGLGYVVLWMIIWSTGSHLYLAISPGIGLRLAKAGQEGRLLGQIGSLESLGSLIGMAVIYWGASRLQLSFGTIFGLAGTCAIIAAICLYRIPPQPLLSAPRRPVFKRKYWLFYSLNILFGARKQIFLPLRLGC